MGGQPRGTRNECLFCELAGSSEDREHFILERGEHCYIIINRYPYTTGHVMVVCNRHVEKFGDLEAGESAEMMAMMARCEDALNQAYGPDGINVGANLGRSAGAGIVGHLHVHLVPRWHGDTNFMSAIGETRVISEDLNDSYERLLAVLSG
jgi:ATP adenylyltransferase